MDPVILQTGKSIGTGGTPDVWEMAEQGSRLTIAYKSGVFAAFEENLEAVKVGEWRSPSYLEELKKISQGRVESVASIRLLDLFLFLIDPGAKEEQKQLRVKAHLAILEGERTLNVSDALDFYPACICLYIFKYSDNEVLQSACKNLQHPYQNFSVPFKWIQELVKHELLKDWGSIFLDQIFSVYLEEEAKLLIYYLLNYLPPQSQKRLLSMLRPALLQRFHQATEEIRDFLNTCLSGSHVSNIPFVDQQRDLFLHLLLEETFEMLEDKQSSGRPKSFLIVGNFYEDDWKRIKEFLSQKADSTCNLQDLSLFWLEQMLDFFQEKQGLSSQVSPFFTTIFEHLNQHLTAFQIDKLKNIAAKIPIGILSAYFDLLQKNFLKHVSDQTLCELLFFASRQSVEKAREVYSKIELLYGFEKLFAICFEGNEKIFFEVHLYSALFVSDQIKVLETCLKNPKRALAKFEAWLCSVHTDLSYPPFVKQFMLQDFSKEVEQVNRPFYLQLKEKVHLFRNSHAIQPSWQQSKVKSAVDILLELVDNPLEKLITELKIFYRTLEKTEKVQAMLLRFCQKAPMEKWLPALEFLHIHCFAENQEELFRRLDACMQERFGINKIDFFVERFIAFDGTGKPYFELISSFFEPPFFTTLQEKLGLLDLFFQRLGPRFLDAFLKKQSQLMILGRHLPLAPDAGRYFLQNWLEMLMQSAYAPLEKMEILQGIAKCYSQQRFLAFLEEQEFESFLPMIASWYQAQPIVMAQILESSLSSLGLLYRFNPSVFSSTLVFYLQRLHEKGDVFAISHCLESASTMISKKDFKEMLDVPELIYFRSIHSKYIQEAMVQKIFQVRKRKIQK